MGKKSKKNISQKQIITSGKEPKNSIDPDSFYGQTPVWSFSFFDSDHDRWGLPIEVKKIRQLVNKLSEWGKLTWKDVLIDTSGRNGNTKNHPIPVERIIKPAQIRLRERNLHEYDFLYSLSITGEYRVWGVLLEGTYFIIWTDPEHEIYPSSKKHT